MPLKRIIGTTKSILSQGTTVLNPATFVYGQKTVAATGTAECIVAISTPLKVGIAIKALSTNTNPVWVGLSSVAVATGFELKAGELIFIPVTDAQSIYIDVTTNGEGVSYIGN